MVKNKKNKNRPSPNKTVGPVGSQSWLEDKKRQESASSNTGNANENQVESTSGEVRSEGTKGASAGAGANTGGAVRRTVNAPNRRDEDGAKGGYVGQTWQQPSRHLDYDDGNSSSRRSEHTSHSPWDSSQRSEHTSRNTWTDSSSKQDEHTSHNTWEPPRHQGSSRKTLLPTPYEHKSNISSGAPGERQYYNNRGSSSRYQNKRESGPYNYPQQNRDPSLERQHNEQLEDNASGVDSIGVWETSHSKSRSNLSTRGGETKYKGRGNYSRDGSFHSHTKDDDDGSRWFDHNKGTFQKAERSAKPSGSAHAPDSDTSFAGYTVFRKEYCKDVKVNEIESDLFQLSKEYSLAHCVAEDMAMGSGIAVNFRRDFKRIDELYQQRQKEGGLAVLDDNDRYIYYLVTKRESNGKPTLNTLFTSLLKMQKHIDDHQIHKLAMPRIGCGLDRLEWSDVKPMLEYIFRNSTVEITVCNFQQPFVDEANDTAQSASLKLKKGFVSHVEYPLVDIENGTIIIYLGSEDGHVSSTMESLDAKFTFIKDYRENKRVVGDIIPSYRFNAQYVLCAFITRKYRTDDDFDFINFQKCIVALSRFNSKKDNKYSYVGFQAFLDHDDLLMTKIVSLLKYGLYPANIYVCWPGNLAAYKPF